MKSKLFMTIAMSAMVLAGCSSSSNAPAASSAVGSAAQSEAAAPTERTKKDVYALGETAEADGVKITVNSERDTDQADDTFNTADKLEEGKTYAIIDATIENGTDEELNVSSVLNFELKDGEGRKADYELPIGSNGQLDGKIAPGDKLAGEMIYTVPRNGELIFSYTPKIGGETVRIKVR